MSDVVDEDTSGWGYAARFRLRSAAARLGSNDDVSRVTGIPKATVQKILGGSGDPGISRVARIAAAAKVSLDEILWGPAGELGGAANLEHPIFSTAVDVVDVTASAGHGSSDMSEVVVGRVDLPADMVRDLGGADALNMIRVAGDSMTPEIGDGDYALVNRSEQARVARDGLVVALFDGMLQVKRLRRVSLGQGEMVSTNSAYPPFPVPLNDPDRFSIKGRVVGVVKRI